MCWGSAHVVPFAVWVKTLRAAASQEKELQELKADCRRKEAQIRALTPVEGQVGACGRAWGREEGVRHCIHPLHTSVAVPYEVPLVPEHKDACPRLSQSAGCACPHTLTTCMCILSLYLSLVGVIVAVRSLYNIQLFKILSSA